MFDRILKRASEVMMWVAIFALCATIIVNALEIFQRFFLGKSMYWIQDVTLLFMMWFIFPGMVRVSYKGADVFVDFFIGKMPEKTQRFLGAINELLSFLICLILCWFSISLAVLRKGKAMMTSEIPYFYYTLAMIVCFGLIAAVYLNKFIGRFRKKEETA